MKKLLTVGVFMILTQVSNAQADSSKVEQYCQLIATPRLLSNKVTIDIDFGDVRRFWQDNRLTDEQGKIRKFNTIIDAMNYMGSEGWIFINAYPVHNAQTEIFHFAFKKQFYRFELQK